MYYTGIDLHKKTSFLTTVDEKGKVVARANLLNVEENLLSYFDTLKEDTKIVIESMASWHWLYDLLTGKGFDVVISNPLKTKAIASAKIKNDKVDSHMLAQLLRADLIATVHVSSLKTRKLKELLRHRARLVRDATRMKNRIRMLMMKNNLSTPVSDLFGVRGMKYLKEVQLPIYHRQQLKSYLELYGHLTKQIEPLTNRIKRLAQRDPMAQLLMTIPGIGFLTAMFIIAEIDDIRRFPSYRHLASYAGLVPSLDASADKSRTGRITKQGSPYLRTALVEAAQTIPRMKKSRLMDMKVGFANIKKDELVSGIREIRVETDEAKRGYGDLYGYGVRYYVDYQLVHEEFYKPGCNGKFSYEIDTTAFENGEHLISVGTCDHNDHVGSSTVKVVINN